MAASTRNQQTNFGKQNISAMDLIPQVVFRLGSVHSCLAAKNPQNISVIMIP